MGVSIPESKVTSLESISSEPGTQCCDAALTPLQQMGVSVNRGPKIDPNMP